MASQAGTGLVLHSDQGSQFTGGDWEAFLIAHGVVCSMTRRGSCHGDADAESVFQPIKREQIRRKFNLTRLRRGVNSSTTSNLSTTPATAMAPMEPCLR